MGCSLWGEFNGGELGVYWAVGGGIFVVIMFYIYNNAILSLPMLKHPTYLSLNFHLRGVESESVGEFG